MVAIGGKTLKKKPHAPTQPQYVVQSANYTNEYLLIGHDDQGNTIVSWIGDPNAATKFDSKYHAKTRIREMENVPSTRCFKQLEQKKG